MVPITNAEEAEVGRFYDNLQDLLERTRKKDAFFIIGDWNAKVGSQVTVTWSNGQVWPWSTKWSRAKANRVLPRECTGYRKHSLPTNERELYTWTSLDGQYKVRLILFFAAKGGEALCSKLKQDIELNVAQITSFLPQNSDLNWRK